MTRTMPAAPRWAGRVHKQKVAQLYKDDANGMHDVELLDDVAYRLLARCESMLLVEAARNGRATCPVCEAIVEHEAKKGALLECKNCGWAGSWSDYRGSMNGLHLIAPGLQPFCREYVNRLPLAKSTKEKMYWIDWLIHRCHWEGTALRGQPGAVCLIRGRAHDVNEFLANLSAGAHSTGEADDLAEHWSAEETERMRRWRRAAERRASKRRSSK